MKWDVIEAKYRGFPLLLRKPMHEDIGKYKKIFPTLLTITHNLSEVDSNGLPKPKYNLSLEKFDQTIINLFNKKKEGIIFLIETFGGKRNYFFYVSPESKHRAKIQNLIKKFKEYTGEVQARNDKNWNFIKKYPLKLI